MLSIKPKSSFFDINEDNYEKKQKLRLDLNFDKNNLKDSISNYKFIPFPANPVFLNIIH